MKKVLILILLGLVSLSMGFGFFLYGNFQKISVQPNTQDRDSALTPAHTPVDSFNNALPYAFILLGYGGGAHEGGKLTDSMMVVHIWPEKKSITLISLPRDLWVSLPLTPEQNSSWKINAAYANGADDRSYRFKPARYTGEAGGGELAKYAVNQVTGLEIDNFVALNFHGFKRSVNVLGGVNVNVEKTFDDFLYPIEGKETDPCGKTDEELKALATVSASIAEKELPCRYEQLHFDRGRTLMSGETALKYVRSRHSAQDGTDFGRAARQRNLLLAVKERVFSLDFFPKVLPFISSLSNDLTTDLTLADMQMFLRYKDELRGFSIHSFALTEDNALMLSRSANGQSILVAKDGVGNWQGVHEWVSTQLVAPITEPAASASASPSPSL